VISPEYKVQLQGIKETVTALERFAPDLKRSLDRKVTKVTRSIATQAKGFIPGSIHPSGWAKQNQSASFIGPLEQGKSRGSKFPAFDPNKAQSGIVPMRPSTKRGTTGFRNAYGVMQKDRAGAIFEAAGRGSTSSRLRGKSSQSRNPRASEQFIGTLSKYYGVLPTARHDGKDKGRALTRAAESQRPAARVQIFAAIKEAEKLAQARMDSVLRAREV